LVSERCPDAFEKHPTPDGSSDLGGLSIEHDADQVSAGGRVHRIWYPAVPSQMD
jgi:hypothetical protein